MQNSTYQDLGNRILKSEQILIFPHVHMDGDAFGSSSALCIALRSLGKDAWILTNEPTPANLDFLTLGCITHNPRIFDHTDLAIMVDCGSLSRIKGREDAFLNASVKACIDHHGVTENDVEFDFGRIESNSAATGEMVWLLYQAMGWPVTLDAANCLFTAITTDTGNFQHANTTKRTHDIVGSFYDIEGFQSKYVSNLIYNRNSYASLKLQAMMMDSIERYGEGKVAIARVTQDMLRRTGCDMQESEGFVQIIMSIDGVEVGCLLKETEGGIIRISLRSRSYVNVANVAQEFGGGGHILAAGCRYHGTVDETEAKIASALIEQIQKDSQK